MLVTVTDGNKLTCDAMCKGFTQKFHGEEYKADMIVVALGSCENDFGCPMAYNTGTNFVGFEKIRMEFKYKTAIE